MTDNRVEIAEDLILDFTGLFTEKPPEMQVPESPVEPPLDSGEYKSSQEREKPAEGLKTGLAGEQTQAPAKALIIESQREEKERKRTLEVYRAYQENTRKSGQLQTEILKGLTAGEDIYSLFLKAVQAISCMTSNTMLYTQAETDIKTIYGAGLLEKPPLKLELEETQTRLQKLTEAQGRERDIDGKQRIGAAIKAHQNRIAELEALIQRTS